eukprot:TRINITY_DN61295_c0_g1_i1.p3 TRINITY_DN61295_c0_g1~~TRINITY_DN61295_c0_g1_i1.p3  ORF type:complete len:118 (-),score=10.23 TRINITY_DN61295_c0_g1_i1:193-546(-)
MACHRTFSRTTGGDCGTRPRTSMTQASAAARKSGPAGPTTEKVWTLGQLVSDSALNKPSYCSGSYRPRALGGLVSASARGGAWQAAGPSCAWQAANHLRLEARPDVGEHGKGTARKA